MRRCSEIFCRLLEYCWISRNLDQVSECVRAGNVSDIIPHALFLSLFHPFPHTHTHTRTFISSITLTRPLPSVNLHGRHFVMMSPSFPLKVDAGALSPQPDTPDTPVSPYFSSPDEVTATWEGGGWGQWHETKPSTLPPLLYLVCFGKFPPPTPTACRQHDLTLSVHLAPQSTHMHTHTLPIDSTTFIPIAWISTTVKL